MRNQMQVVYLGCGPGNSEYWDEEVAWARSGKAKKTCATKPVPNEMGCNLVLTGFSGSQDIMWGSEASQLKNEAAKAFYTNSCQSLDDSCSGDFPLLVLPQAEWARHETKTLAVGNWLCKCWPGKTWRHVRSGFESLGSICWQHSFNQKWGHKHEFLL